MEIVFDYSNAPSKSCISPFALKQCLVSYSRRLLSLEALGPTNLHIVPTIFDGILAIAFVLHFEKIPNKFSTFKSQQIYLLDVNTRFNVKKQREREFFHIDHYRPVIDFILIRCCLKLSLVFQFIFFSFSFFSLFTKYFWRQYLEMLQEPTEKADWFYKLNFKTLLTLK